MATELLMPALSPTMEEGTIANWLVEENQEIKSGDVIAEIETDKATMEFEAPSDGILGRILVASGTEGVAINTPIAIVLDEGESQADLTIPAATPRPEKVSITEAKLEPPQPAPPQSQTDRIKVSPLARRLADEAGIELANVQGSGPRGRIIKADIEKATDKASVISGHKHSLADGNQTPESQSIYAEDSYEVVQLDSMRRTIARRLTESKQTVPHFYLRADVELDGLMTLRKHLNASAKGSGGSPSYKISVNDMVIKALALAMLEVPDANVTWADGNMLKHHTVDVSVAVAIDGGLITPVLRNVQSKSISTISNEMKDMAARARERHLKPEEYQGGTTSVSNLGMFGISSFDAVINPPQGTILAVGAGEQKCVVVDGEPKVATVMTVTLSVDHRVIDGAIGAKLLSAFKENTSKNQ